MAGFMATSKRTGLQVLIIAPVAMESQARKLGHVTLGQHARGPGAFGLQQGEKWGELEKLTLNKKEPANRYES